TDLVECRANLEAEILMHELGHNLGLCHGGPVTSLASAPDLGDACEAPGLVDDYKPNELSVMSYFYSTMIGAHLDYSRWKIPALDETFLDERLGIQPLSNRSRPWSTEFP